MRRIVVSPSRFGAELAVRTVWTGSTRLHARIERATARSTPWTDRAGSAAEPTFLRRRDRGKPRCLAQLVDEGLPAKGDTGLLGWDGDRSRPPPVASHHHQQEQATQRP